MGISPSREATSCAATQEFPYILRNPMVHYCVHKSPPLVPVMSRMKPVYTALLSVFNGFITYPSLLEAVGI
jgi:hypothetical protein